MRWLIPFSIAFLFVSHANAHYILYEDKQGDTLAWWVPDSCCHGRDCYKAAPGEVTYTEQGYLIQPQGKTFSYDSDKVEMGNPSQDFVLCRQYKNKAVLPHCLFPPGPGM